MNAERPTSNPERRSAPSGRSKYDLEERLLNYAAMIIKLVEKLPDTRTANHIAGQLLRSGTSPLGNHGEAEAAESAQDFAHKLKICLKELRESKRWLLLIQKVRILQAPGLLSDALNETEQLIRIFVASIRTVEERRQAPDRRKRRYEEP